MVVIRMQRRGTKKTPHHRIVATEKSRSQGGRILETLGYYDPSYQPPRLSLNETRIAHWVSVGAQVSHAVATLVKHTKQVKGDR